MLDALREVQVAGVATNLELLERIVGSSNFLRGPLQTDSWPNCRELTLTLWSFFARHDLALGVTGKVSRLGWLNTKLTLGCARRFSHQRRE